MTKLLVTKEIGLWELIKHIGDKNITSKVFEATNEVIKGAKGVIRVTSNGTIITENIKSGLLFQIKSYEELQEDTYIDDVMYSFKPNWDYDRNIIKFDKHVSLEEIIDMTYEEELLNVYSLQANEDGSIEKTLIYENGEIV